MQRRWQWCRILAIGLVAVAAVGCNDTEKTVEPAEAPPPNIRPADDYPDIVVLDGLAEILRWSPPNVLREEHTPLQVFVPVRLRSPNRVEIQYQFEFFREGEDGALVPVSVAEGEGWRFARLPGLSPHTLTGSAVNPSATHWRLTVRRAK